MGARDIDNLSMIMAFGALLLSLSIYKITRAGLYKELLISTGRMSVQLFLAGLYLTGLFRLNHPVVNIGYILLMMAAANIAVLKNSGLKPGMFLYTFPAIGLAIGSVLTYFMLLVFKPFPLYDARYLVPISGMLLGNSMNRTIITLERFYSSVKKDEEGVAALVAMGASAGESTAPYLKTAYLAGLGPVLANMATMGIVSLPGMMTGQILGGSAPLVAIKYQIAIILAIYSSSDLSSLLCIHFSRRKGFNSFGFLNSDIFKIKKPGKSS
jgi:putative ABC transport system permease protein